MFKTCIGLLLIAICDLVMSQMTMTPYHFGCLLLFSLVHLAFSQNFSFHIMDGEEAAQGEFPFVVSLLDANRNHFCTASILNDNTILTATHCLLRKNGSQLAVYVGHVDLSGRHSNLKYVYKVKKAIVHKGFRNDHTVAADVGVLKLEKSIPLTRYTQQVCLPTEESQPDLGNCVAMGWGRMANQQFPMRLQKLNMRLTYKCRDLHDRQRVLCAVGAAGKGGVCFGDSGGPLMCSVKGKPGLWLQYGVCSYMDSWVCRGASYYARVSHYLAWIQKYAQD